MYETFALTLSVEIWQLWFNLAVQEDRNPSDYLRTLLEREAKYQLNPEEERMVNHA